MFWKKGVPRNFAELTGILFFKISENFMPEPCNFIKNETTPIQVFPCEFWEISKNTFSYRTPPVAASVTRYIFLLLNENDKFTQGSVASGLLFRSSYRNSSMKIDFLKNFSEFKGIHQCWSLFFNKVARFRHRIFRNL